MVETAIITLREGLEAVLIVTIILTVLRQRGRADLQPWVLAGLSVATALAVGGVFWIPELLSRWRVHEEAYEGALYLVGSLARSSVLGVRPSALIRSRVPGARYPGPGTRYRVLVFEKPAHGVCMMQDRAESHPAYPMGSVPGSVLGARYPAFSHRRMRGEGDTTFPCPSPPRPGRGPRTESRPPNPAPLPYCPIALLPYCPTAFPSFWTRHSLTHLQIFEIIVHYSCL